MQRVINREAGGVGRQNAAIGELHFAKAELTAGSGADGAGGDAEPALRQYVTGEGIGAGQEPRASVTLGDGQDAAVVGEARAYRVGVIAGASQSQSLDAGDGIL